MLDEQQDDCDCSKKLALMGWECLMSSRMIVDCSKIVGSNGMGDEQQDDCG